jgi:amino acid transporter
VLEYTVASASVAHGWSKYFQNFIGMFNIKVPHIMSTAPFDYDPTTGHFLGTSSWFDLPSLAIVTILTIILVKGIHESSRFNNLMVAIKVVVVLLAMARDRLLPESFFGAVHPRFRTPWKSTILTGIMVGSMASFIPLGILAELVNIETLFAFIIVCAAVLIMRYTNPQAERPFRCPLSPLVPVLGVLFCLVLMFSLPAANWLRLGIWMAVGMLIYLFYGRHRSVMARNG